MKKVPPELDKIVNKVLAYKPKSIAKKEKQKEQEKVKGVKYIIPFFKRLPNINEVRS